MGRKTYEREIRPKVGLFDLLKDKNIVKIVLSKSWTKLPTHVVDDDSAHLCRSWDQVRRYKGSDQSLTSCETLLQKSEIAKFVRILQVTKLVDHLRPDLSSAWNIGGPGTLRSFITHLS